MKFLKQFLIIIFVSFIGEALNFLLPFPIPASIYGIVIMFLALEFKLIPLESVKDTGKFLIEIMPVMFVPAAVGLITSWDVLRPSLLEYAVITVVTTFVVMVVSGAVSQVLLRIINERGDGNE